MRSLYILSALLCASTAYAATSSSCSDGICPFPRPNHGAEAAPGDRMAPARLPRHADSVVRIAVQLGRSRVFGSGCIVDCNERHALVLTCGHLFRDGAGQIVVECRDGSSYGAKLLSVDSANDLAAIFIRKPAGCQPAAVARTVPPVGDPLAYCGFGPVGQLVYQVGPLRSLVRSEISGDANAMLIAGAARQGDSGGPVFDENGEIVGVVVATDGREVVAPSCLPIRRLLARFSDRFKTPSDIPPLLRKNRRGVPSRADDRRNPDNERSAETKPNANTPSVVDAIVALRARIDSLSAGVEKVKEVGWIETILPIALGALGISFPPVTAWCAWKVFRVWRKRRRRKQMRRSRRGNNRNRAAKPSHDSIEDRPRRTGRRTSRRRKPRRPNGSRPS